MRRVSLLAACGLLGGCMAESPAALQSPDIHAMSVTGNYAAAVDAQFRTAGNVIAGAQSGPQAGPALTPPSRTVTCVSPGYTVPTTGC